jgi:hypothetical protein
MMALLSEFNHVFCDVFADDEIVLTEATNADDVEGWDSRKALRNHVLDR